MATIPLGGLATGLDTETIIQKTLAVEAQPLNALQTKKVKFQALSTAFTDLNSKLVTLKARADGLKDPATFFARSVSSSVDTVATATAANGNLRGTFTLTSTGLARGSIATAGVTKANLTDTVATASGNFQFKLGATGTVVSVAVTDTTTLDQLAKAINNANGGVKATTVNTGTSAVPAYKLTLTSNATGTANNIVIVNDPTTLTIANSQAATDATFSISGLGAFTRSTNTFSDVIDGVNITLKAASGSTDLSIDYDKSTTQAKVQSLIDGFNDVVRSIDSQTIAKKNSDGSLSTGAFTGDAIPRVIRTGLANTVASKISGVFSRLADVGITTQKDGTLSLDATKFQKALNDDPASVATLFTGTATTDGIADLISARVDTQTKTLSGTIAVRQDGITATIKSIQTQIDQGLTRLSASETSLRQRFAHLEQLVSKTQRTGSALLASLGNLNNLSNGSSNSSNGG